MVPVAYWRQNRSGCAPLLRSVHGVAEIRSKKTQALLDIHDLGFLDIQKTDRRFIPCGQKTATIPIPTPCWRLLLHLLCL